MPYLHNTLHLLVDPYRPEPKSIALAARAICNGELVAFPTETVYGLGADALNPDAVGKIFQAKGRPADNPLILHISKMQELDQLTPEVPSLAQTLAVHFWPGPLTLVVRRSPSVPYITTGGLETVAVRMPAHPVALALLQMSGRPLAAPSANLSGRPSPTTASHVLEDLGGRVALVLDAGPTSVGVESTVLDVTERPPVLLRPGGITREELEAILGEVGTPRERGHDANRSPGTRYRHYAPRASVVLAPGEQIEEVVLRFLEEGQIVGVMTRVPMSLHHPNVRMHYLGKSLTQYAQQLFSNLRHLDDEGCHVIVAECVEEQGLGVAVMDRLKRAAAGSPRADNSRSLG